VIRILGTQATASSVVAPWITPACELTHAIRDAGLVIGMDWRGTKAVLQSLVAKKSY
jgi:hypothetical protein